MKQKQRERERERQKMLRADALNLDDDFIGLKAAGLFRVPRTKTFFFLLKKFVIFLANSMSTSRHVCWFCQKQNGRQKVATVHGNIQIWRKKKCLNPAELFACLALSNVSVARALAGHSSMNRNLFGSVCVCKSNTHTHTHTRHNLRIIIKSIHHKLKWCIQIPLSAHKRKCWPFGHKSNKYFFFSVDKCIKQVRDHAAVPLTRTCTSQPLITEFSFPKTKKSEASSFRLLNFPLCFGGVRHYANEMLIGRLVLHSPLDH